MSRETFDRLKLPIALGVALMLVAGYVFIRRAEAESSASAPRPSIVVGVPGGGVVTPMPIPTPQASPSPTATPVATVPPTPTAAPTAVPADFVAQVMACRAIDDNRCLEEVDQLRPADEDFVALLLFENARVGDVMNAVLEGPSGTLDGGPYTLPGNGSGWYYSTFAVADLPPGEYTLTGLRNGQPVARIQLSKTGGGNDDDDDD